MAAEKDIIINLILILLFSGLIGFERERNDRPAGLRTHILVGVGATIIMMISLSMHAIHVENDAGRIAAQIVSGIGFLGAGTIIKEGFSVKGLTTAASLWATAAIGMAIGGGNYFLASLTTVVVLVTLFILDNFDFSSGSKKYRNIKCTITNKKDLISKMNQIITDNKISIKKINVAKIDKETTNVRYTLKTKNAEQLIELSNDLLQLENVLELNIHP
ncbi:MAG: MgtC/SapB family protein [Halanaerobium sp.]